MCGGNTQRPRHKPVEGRRRQGVERLEIGSDRERESDGTVPFWRRSATVGVFFPVGTGPPAWFPTCPHSKPLIDARLPGPTPIQSTASRPLRPAPSPVIPAIARLCSAGAHSSTQRRQASPGSGSGIDISAGGPWPLFADLLRCLAGPPPPSLATRHADGPPATCMPGLGPSSTSRLRARLSRCLPVLNV